MLQLEKDELRLWEMAASFAAGSKGADAAMQVADDLVLGFRARRSHLTGHAGPPPVTRPQPPNPPQPPPARPPGAPGPTEPFKATPLPGAKPPPPAPARKLKPVAEMTLNEKLDELGRLQEKFSKEPSSLNPEEMAAMVALIGDETLRRITVKEGFAPGQSSHA